MVNVSLVRLYLLIQVVQDASVDQSPDVDLPIHLSKS